ncbi:hypothetical protein PBT90_15440 [Algoriphagus halophytocola]|uniref:Uncharacterized protein n=1 Tax=Algoriphagus halophytocola TaxID=2991499 RepID=A0ABY6MBJ0_9BACT|nr:MULTISPECIES: hypothetical protein [unclassified Algoriphagus]UZD20967.1 hypothetical protein OM944_09775 [Algoriphagus sp. TR-M5]WBL42133.1 hypothetical protein PBT90_15440 [Algoriphagus sp. TR-M9]
MKILLLTLLLWATSILQPADPIIPSKIYDINTMHRKNQASKSPKRIYIQKFRALFEVYEKATASTQASKKERANRATYVSGTKTSMGVQLSGVDVPEFQKMINEAYADFVAQLEAEGFEIITADEAGQSEYYKGYTKVKGGASSTAQALGFVMVTPEGYEYWVKGLDNSGREKSTFTDTSSKLSQDLGDAYVAEATFIFPFVNLDANSSGFTNSSSVKAKMNLHLSSALDVSDNQQTTSLTSSLKGFANAGNQERFYSRVRILAGHFASAPVFDASVGLKKNVDFEGVFAETKVQETTAAQVDYFSKSSYPQLVMVSGDEINLASHYAACDPAKYMEVTQGSMKEMIDTGIQTFKDLLKK